MDEFQLTDFPKLYSTNKKDVERFAEQVYSSAIGVVATYAVYCGHIVMSETGGYKKVSNWIKQKSEKVKSKFKKKAE